MLIRKSHTDYSMFHEQLKKDKTRKRYIADAWEPFLEFGKTKGFFVNDGPESGLFKNSASCDLILDFLRFRREKGYSGNSLRTLLSQVSSLIYYFYDIVVSSVSHLRI